MESPRSKSLILNVIVGIVALMIALQIYKGKMKEKDSLLLEKETEQKKNAVLANIADLEKDMDVLQTYVAKKDSSDIVNILSNIAKQSSVQITSIRPQSSESGNFYTKDLFTLSVSAPDYHELSKFVANVESYPENIFIIEAVNVDAGDTRANNLNAQIQLSTIFTGQK